MAQKYPKQNLVFPVLGLHEGVGYDIQPPGTTADALNVRGYDPIKQRLRGGRRPGQSKWHADQINGSNAIQLMQKVVQAREPELASVTPDPNLADYAVAATSPYFLGDWVPVAVSASGVGGLSLAAGMAVEAGPPKAIMMQEPTGELNRITVLRSGYRTTRDMTVTMMPAPTTTGTNNRLLDLGVMFRGNVGLGGCFVGFWTIVSADRVRFAVYYREYGQSYTQVATSPTFDVSGDSTPADGLTVRVDWTDSNLVSITIVWSDSTQQATDPQWIGTTFTFTSTDLVGDEYAYGGPLTYDTGTGGAYEHRFTGIAVTFEKPNPPNILFTIEDDESFSADQYELPDGWSRWDVSNVGVVSDESDGPESSAVFFEPSIDTSSVYFRGTANAFTAAAARSFIRRTTAPTVRQSIELRFSDDGRHSGNQDMAAAFAVSDDLAKYISVNFRAAGSSGADGYAIKTVSTASVVIFGSSATLAVDTTTINPIYGRAVLDSSDGAGQWVRVTFDGEVIRVYVAGGEWFSYALTASDLTNLGYTATTVPVRNGIGFAWGHQARIIEFVEGEQQAIQDQLVVLAGGTIKVLADGVLSTPTGGSSALSPALYRAQAQAAYGRVFFVDGDAMKVYRYSTNLVTDWTATAGTVPAKARLMALYRGRVVVSGVQSDPHNWFMPKLGDPFDFDYSPAVPSAIQAVAGNNSDAGLIGDIITALIPFGDDYMWIGGDHTIWQMTGDPAAGGTIDQVTDKTGILFGKAWTKNPRNELFFAALDGIYKAIPNALPENMTKGRLDKRIRDIDTSAYRVFLEWDYLRWGLVVMYMALDSTVANIAFFWDARSDAWWPDEYSATHGPSSIYAFDGLAANDQAMLVGGRDGYIRKVDDAAADDDGTAITSRVRFSPLIAPDHSSEVVAETVIPVLAKDSGPVDLKIYTGQTAEGCVTATNPRVKRTLLRGGRNPMIRQKVRGYAIQHELSQTAAGSRWALENLTVEFAKGGIPRRDAVRNTDG